MKPSRDSDVSLDAAASCFRLGPLSVLRNDIKALSIHPCSNFNLPKQEPLLDLTDQNLHFLHLGVYVVGCHPNQTVHMRQLCCMLSCGSVGTSCLPFFCAGVWRKAVSPRPSQIQSYFKVSVGNIISCLVFLSGLQVKVWRW